MLLFPSILHKAEKMKYTPSNMTWLNLPNMPAPIKALFAGYLLVIGIGLCMAGLQIMLTHGMADGKVGLSINDIVYSYYGDRSGSTLAAKLNGSMQDKAPIEVRQDIIKWAEAGAPEAQWETHYKAVFAQHCTMCHSQIPGIPNFTNYEEVQSVAETDQGASISGLTRVSHIHLFGISFIFFFMAFIFSFAVNIPKRRKMIVIAIPFAFLIIDVMSWWLTKLSPHFAWFTIIGGIGYSLASAYMWFTSMFQMFLYKSGDQLYGNAWEQDL